MKKQSKVSHALLADANPAPVRVQNKWYVTKLILLFFVFVFGLTLQSCKKEELGPLQSEKYIQLNEDMRKLWSDHMHWTWATVEAFFHNPNALNDDLNRLLQNQQDIGAAIVPYYGQAAGGPVGFTVNRAYQFGCSCVAGCSK